jgi:hypothetical protein
LTQFQGVYMALVPVCTSMYLRINVPQRAGQWLPARAARGVGFEARRPHMWGFHLRASLATD